jgi:hypothetical protein
LPFDAAISIQATGITDVLGNPATFDGSAFQTVSDPGPLTGNPGFEGTQGWIGLETAGSGSSTGFVPVEGQLYAHLGQSDVLLGYLDVPSNATTLSFHAGMFEYLQCGGRPAEVTLESASGVEHLFPPLNAPTEPCDDCISGQLIPWTEISTGLESLRGQRVVVRATASGYTECLPDVYEEVVLDDFRIE